MIISDVEGVLDNEKKLIPEIDSIKANKLIGVAKTQSIIQV